MHNKLIPVDVFLPSFTNYDVLPIRSCVYSSVNQSVSQSVCLSGFNCVSPIYPRIHPSIHPFFLLAALCARLSADRSICPSFRSDLEIIFKPVAAV